MEVKRGEIYWVEFSPVKRNEQSGLRPVLVVQQDIGIQFSPTTVVVAVTHTLPPRPYPFVVVIEPEDSGPPGRSAVNCSQIATIQKDGPDSRMRPPKGESIVRAVGRLGARKMEEVEDALRYNLGLT